MTTNSITIKEFDGDISNTCCLIDFDGTLANSLVWYNQALDAMFMGKLTDKHYVEHYKEFGDAYEIIPGSPWKSILMNLCRYLSTSHLVNTPIYKDEYDIVSSRACIDIGQLDAILLIAYDVDFYAYDFENNIVYYTSDDMTIAAVLGECMLPADIKTIDDFCNSEKLAPARIFSVSGYVASVGEPKDNPDFERIFYVKDIEDKMSSMFNEYCIEAFKSATYDTLAIDPIVRFCREYKNAGGKLVIHSGSNEAIVKEMISILDIEDLFDGWLCSDMLENVNFAALSPWGYKTLLLNKVIEDHAADDTSFFVVGDTKGDAYGAYEVSLPFYLVWRGYPSDPNCLKGSEEQTLTPNAWGDYLQEELDVVDVDDDARQNVQDAVDSFVDFVGRVSTGEEEAVQVSG